MTAADIFVLSVPTPVHGRVLVRAARTPARGVLAGFHGYMENAAIQMQRLAEIPGSDAWTLVSIQALHRFYRGRSQEVVAGWMTREDREDAIADNIAYVDHALAAAAPGAEPVVYIGFSQGVAMAFRAAVRGARRAAGVIAVGGDVPPELLADSSTIFPRLLLIRGQRDEWYTEDKLAADVAAFERRGVGFEVDVPDAGHEWTPSIAARAARFLT
jgi:predicted esterase